VIMFSVQSDTRKRVSLFLQPNPLTLKADSNFN
jgi:hypothetical protein